MPKRLQKDEASATETYAKFVADPFETGYGHTIGNSLRRVLLSSLEGAAITSLKVDGAMHEFATIDGVAEDVTDIVLNLKKVKFKAHTRDEQTLLLSVNKDGAVTAAEEHRAVPAIDDLRGDAARVELRAREVEVAFWQHVRERPHHPLAHLAGVRVEQNGDPVIGLTGSGNNTVGTKGLSPHGGWVTAQTLPIDPPR